MTTIQWTNVTRKLADLIPWAMNPREINEKQAERLEHSFKVFGQVETIAIGPDNQVYNGHQRLKVLMAEYGRDYVVECRQSSRPLTEREQQQLTVYLHEGATGQWDFDTLGNWDVEIDELIDWGFSPAKLGLVDFQNLDDVEFKEYDESVADDVEMCECPNCGHKFPK